MVSQPELLAELSAKLSELPALLKGGTCLNSWGWGVDDVVLLPLLRAFTCVKGALFPSAVEAYLGIEQTQSPEAGIYVAMIITLSAAFGGALALIAKEHRAEQEVIKKAEQLPTFAYFKEGEYARMGLD